MTAVSEPILISTENGGQRVTVDRSLGTIRRLELSVDGRVLEPLHAAPWLDEPDVQVRSDLLPVEKRLSGDFFCAPFGASDLTDAPAHGWTANSQWTQADQAPGAFRFTLDRTVMGAQITKRLQLSEDAPILYQTHEIKGGDGGLTVAHHPMVDVSDGATFSTSKKRAVIAPDQPLDAGRNRLAVGTVSSDLSAIPASDGGTVDLHRLPIADRHEDFVTLVEARTSGLGWSAIVRSNDVIVILKDAAVLPVTMLWHSNAGRDYAPWNGRHTGILGIEDGCAAGAAGHRAALTSNAIADQGVPTALTLVDGHTHTIRHAIAAFPRPSGWRRVADVNLTGSTLTITGDDGDDVRWPFDPNFLEGATDGNG
ncbi:MAG: hypothetical protein AAF619_04460 [Pseudomonadota bacterium]